MGENTHTDIRGRALLGGRNGMQQQAEARKAVDKNRKDALMTYA